MLIQVNLKSGGALAFPSQRDADEFMADMRKRLGYDPADSTPPADPAKLFRYEATVLGQLASKANSRKVVSWGRRIGSIKSEPARQFVSDFLRQLGRNRKPFTGPVRLTAHIHYRSLQSDLEPALLMDCIQEGTPKNPGACIIKNDRQVWDLKVQRRLDKENPRVWFLVEELSAEEFKLMGGRS